MVQWILIGVGAALLLNSGSGAGAFATGQYRNLFAEAGHPPEQARRRLQGHRQDRVFPLQYCLKHDLAASD